MIFNIDTTRSAGAVETRPDTGDRPSFSFPSDGRLVTRPPAPLSGSISAYDRLMLEYRYTGDIPAWMPGAFLRGLGESRRAQELSFHGIRGPSVGFFLDGAPLHDPVTGWYDMNLLPSEATAATEYLSPLAPAGAFAPPSGGGVNFVTAAFSAPSALSRVRYTQAGNGFSEVDAFLSQDVADGFNVALGLERPTYEGRFENSAVDGWNTRARIAYTAGSASFTLNELFTKREVGLNDGVDLATPDSLRFDPILAGIVNPDASEQVIRHDLSLTAAAGQAYDSLASWLFRGFYTWQRREYRDEENLPNSNGVFFRERSLFERFGVMALHRREILGHPVEISFSHHVDASLQNPFLPSTRETGTSLGISGTLNIVGGRVTGEGGTGGPDAPSAMPAAAPALGFRLLPYFTFRSLRETFEPSFGLSAEAGVGGVTVGAGYSRTPRFPTMREIGSTDSLVLPVDAVSGESIDPEIHEIVAITASARNEAGSRIGVEAVRRTIADPIGLAAGGAGDPAGTFRYARVDDRTISSVSVSGTLRVGWIAFDLSGVYTDLEGGTGRNDLPRWSGTAGLYYRDLILEGNLDLKAGFQTRAFTSYDADGYSERRMLWYPVTTEFPAAPGNPQPPPGDPDATVPLTIASAAVVDFLLVAGIGDAYVHIHWENLFARDYVETSFYPKNDRAFRFGLTWTFLD